MRLSWVRGCPPDPPGCQSGRSATGAGDVHAQGPASGLWVTLYPSRPTGRLDHPRTAGGALAGGSATGSTPSSGPGAGPGGPEGRDRTAAPRPGQRLGPRVRRAVDVLVGRPPAQICAPYFVLHLTRPLSTGPGNRHIKCDIPCFPCKSNQAGVFAHHALILLQPAHGAPVFQGARFARLAHGASPPQT